MRDGTAEPVSRDQILRRERGQANIHFLCSADHEQDRQPFTRLIHALLYVMIIHTSTTYTLYLLLQARLFLVSATQQVEVYYNK